MTEGSSAESTLNSHPINRVFCLLQGAFFLAAAVVMGVGLVKSYSRGAWVATALGLLWLGINREIRQRRENPPVRRASWFSCRSCVSWAALLMVSLCALGFWGFRDTEWRVARRVVSVGNINDFSWRNRLAAWEGALQMMADKPWFGFGWNQPERVYDSFYRPARLTEGGAMQMNDYLMLGSTLGVPALLCFLMYVGLCLTRPMEDRGRRTEDGPPSNNHGPRTTDHGPPCTDHRILIADCWLKAVCRAGAVVLLVGFWFDGGLFKLATAAPFWILLELGRNE